MPNHTSTKLIVTGDDAELNEMIDFVKSSRINKDTGKPYGFSLQAINPMPDVLHNVQCPVRVVSEEEYQNAVKEQGRAKNDPAFSDSILASIGLPITQKMRDQYRKDYGCDNWLDWARINWGTKWDVYEISEWVRKKGTASIRFESAWTPINVIPIVSERFKGLHFTLKFADEGGGFLGYETYSQGKLLETVDVGWNSDDGKKLRRQLRR